MKSMIARLVIRLAVLFSRVGINEVILLREFDSDSSETNLNPIFCCTVMIDCFAEFSMASGLSRKALILGLIKVILKKNRQPDDE